MRSHESQFSDARPIRRTLEEKRRLVTELRETLATMKNHASAITRDAIKARIKELEVDIASAPPPRERDDRRALTDPALNPRRRGPRVTF